ncbi:LOW QUALITY PROTEIN: hypothetical protein YC2023_029280 [Brassica napus]
MTQAQAQYTKDTSERNRHLPQNRSAVIARAGPGRVWRTRSLSPPSQRTSWTNACHSRPKPHVPNRSSFIWRRRNYEPPHAIEPAPERQSPILHQKAKWTRTALDQPSVLVDSARAATKKASRDRLLASSHTPLQRRTRNRSSRLGNESNTIEAPVRMVNQPKKERHRDQQDDGRNTAAPPSEGP